MLILKIFSNNTKQGKAKHKLGSLLYSYTRLIDDLAKEVKLISAKGLTKKMINGYSFLTVKNIFLMMGQ